METNALRSTDRDRFDEQLVANTRPADWQNPSGTGRYHLVVVGAGAAGLITAAGAAGLGARVALIERHRLGGDCLHAGCVPSKALIRIARVAATARGASAWGVNHADDATVDFAAAMERMRRLRAELSPVDSANRYRALGVDVYFGHAEFLNENTLRVNDTSLSFRRAVIATGGRAAVANIPGLAEAGFHTNESIFGLTERPARLAVIGAGPIGCELAQVFARFGSRVTLYESTRGILPREDRDAASLVRQSLLRDGVEIVCASRVLRVERTASGKRLIDEGQSPAMAREVDEILVAVGRVPNIESLGLTAAGVAYNDRGVLVDDFLRTSNRAILAAGDVCAAHPQFTHAADTMARIAVQNALFPGRARFSTATIPWCTYTSPEVAHVGLYEHEAKQQGIDYTVYEHSMHEVDRARLDDDTEGFVRVLVKRQTDHILGATIVASHAGEMISEITLAMTGRLGLRTIAQTIHPYPTRNEAIKKVADAYMRSRLTPRLKGLLRHWFAWFR